MATAAQIAGTNPNPAVADIAHAERRRAMLERLAVLGMVLAEETTQRAVDSPYHPEAVHEPCRAFAQVSRAVRLTVVLEAKMELEVVALRNGSAITTTATTGGPTPWGPLSEADRLDLTHPRRKAPVHDDSESLVEQTRECLTDREDDSRLAGNFRAAVETICSDLGVDPDWSRWPDAAAATDVPIVPMLAQLLATAKTPAVSAACDDSAMGCPEPHPPPGI